ncbi:MAG: hypothetical protein AM326_11330 [Candidatus Thorarchaeota archaeon SMTZ-45]|nr:MAG: hypothetical protein AM326_11330 [Candidatus Thorarchaeota archaeon SMTZ-45]KXH73396.1 MAG: hypothetical protein AM325_07705 [Candidatus Thorarchaeota archaeon SMTZ1-45]
MIIITVVTLLAWRLLRRFRKQYSLAIFLVVIAITSFLVMYDVKTAGVFRENITPDYDIVHYNSFVLFPFVVQKHHNWSSQEYFYRVLLLGREGSVKYEETPKPDQSEYMHLSLVVISAIFCVLGFLSASLVIIVVEFVNWYRFRKGVRCEER